MPQVLARYLQRIGVAPTKVNVAELRKRMPIKRDNVMVRCVISVQFISFRERVRSAGGVSEVTYFDDITHGGVYAQTDVGAERAWRHCRVDKKL